MDVYSQLTAWAAADPGRPKVTWYGPDGERVELSAKGLHNWVSKTANLLVDELDAEPGTRLGLDLPVHWRTVVWLLAAWSAGLHVCFSPQAVNVLVTTAGAATGSADEWPGALIVVQALPALAVRADPPVAQGWYDGAAEIRLQPDVFIAPTVTGHPETAPIPADRTLIVGPPAEAHQQWWQTLAAGGSIVLHHAPNQVDSVLRSSERITAVR
jgi:uncharacterized protein (TIGR03089 family)